MLVCRLQRVTPINLIHYLLSPPDGIGDNADRRRNPRPTSYCASFRAARAGSDQKNAFANFIHLGQHIIFRVLFANCYGSYRIA